MDNNPFDYNDADDGEIYIPPFSVALMQVVVRVSACTLAGDTDPDWRHVRYKHSDDATGIFAELAQ
jgi:hypothetical protein